jgi:hypothetical protein
LAGDALPGMRRDQSADDSGQSRLPFREPRLLAILGHRRGDESQRLAAEMAETWYQAGGDSEVRCASALELVKLAAVELGNRRREAAWALSLAARRELIHALDEREHEALAVSVREQSAKLDSWRRRAVEKLVPGDGHVPNAAALVEALQHIDAANSNQARAQRLLRRQLAILAVVLLATAGILMALVVAWLPASQPGPSSSGPTVPSSPLSGLATDQLAVLAALFGIIGACISSMQRTTSDRRRMRVPQLRAASWASLTRPLVGAAVGLVVWALAAEGILGSQGLGVLGFAFAAGFSERVIVRFIPGSSDSAAGSSDQSIADQTRRDLPEGKASD